MPFDLDEEYGARGDDDGVDLVATAAGLDEVLEGEEVEGSPVGEHLGEVLHGDLLVVVGGGADFLTGLVERHPNDRLRRTIAGPAMARDGGGVCVTIDGGWKGERRARDEACPCAGGRAGTQRCSDDGTFGACRCPSAPSDAGTAIDAGALLDAAVFDQGSVAVDVASDVRATPADVTVFDTAAASSDAPDASIALPGCELGTPCDQDGDGRGGMDATARRPTAAIGVTSAVGLGAGGGTLARLATGRAMGWGYATRWIASCRRWAAHPGAG